MDRHIASSKLTPLLQLDVRVKMSLLVWGCEQEIVWFITPPPTYTSSSQKQRQRLLNDEGTWA